MQRQIVKNTYLKQNLSHNQLHRCNVPPNHRQACSSISQQHYHPQAARDSSRNKGQSRITHSQGTPINQAHTVGFIKLSRRYGRLNAKLVTSNTSFLKHTSSPTLNSPKTNHCIPQQKKSSQLYEEEEDHRVTTPNKR